MRPAMHFVIAAVLLTAALRSCGEDHPPAAPTILDGFPNREDKEIRINGNSFSAANDRLPLILGANWRYTYGENFGWTGAGVGNGLA